MRVVMLAIVMALLLALLAAPAFAAQPGKECGEDGPDTPGFTSEGFMNQAEPHYAGSEENPNQGNQDKAVSQYDVACFQQPANRD